MIALLVSLALIVLAVTATILILGADGRDSATLKGRLREDLTQSGLSLTGDPLGSYELTGSLHGVDVALQSRVALRLPGPSSESRSCGVVKVSAPLPDLLVCRTLDVDSVMGPLPNVPRLRTADARFDASYSVFAVDVPPGAGNDFRTAPESLALAWAKPPVLKLMTSLDFSWLRVKDGRCEVVVDPIDPSNVEAVLALGTSIARAASGQPIVAPETLPSKPAPEPPSIAAPVLVAGCAALFGSVFAWMILGFIPFLRSLTESDVCGNGGHILVSEASDGSGTSYGLYCSNDVSKSLFLHFAICDLLFVALVSILCLVMTARLRASRRLWIKTHFSMIGRTT